MIRHVTSAFALAALAAACAPETDEPAAKPAASVNIARVVNLEQLEALLASKRGKGLLLNFWATW